MLKPHDKAHEQTIVKRGGGKHKHDDHGGAWKVAFADFCLALCCLFLVLWLMAARNTESLEQILTEADGAKTDQGKGVMPQQVGGPRGSMIERFPMPRTGNSDSEGSSKAAGDPNPQVTPSKVTYDSPNDLQALAKSMSKLSAEYGLTSNLESIVTPYGLRIMLHDTERQGMFVRGSAVPTDRFRALLRSMGPIFAQMENQMLIVGHTDSLQYADTSYAAFSNWTLSANRAMSARSQLLFGGMNKESVLQVVGMARPRAAGHPARRRRRQPPHRDPGADHHPGQDHCVDVRRARRQERAQRNHRHRHARPEPAAKAARQVGHGRKQAPQISGTTMESKSIRGSRMRITTATPDGVAVQRVADPAPPEAAEAPVRADTAAPLQSAVLQPALQALKDMPEMDMARVNLLRDALAKGELPFDPGKLASLIQRFHGSER